MLRSALLALAITSCAAPHHAPHMRLFDDAYGAPTEQQLDDCDALDGGIFDTTFPALPPADAPLHIICLPLDYADALAAAAH